jgi:hypothetical protein
VGKEGPEMTLSKVSLKHAALFRSMYNGSEIVACCFADDMFNVLGVPSFSPSCSQ